MKIFKSHKDITMEYLLEWSEKEDRSICTDFYEDKEVVLDEEDWSAFMREHGAKFVGIAAIKDNPNQKCYIYELENGRKIEIYCFLSEYECGDVYLDLSNVYSY